MRQVTGSNQQPQRNDVSIRLNSGGHSFSVDTAMRQVPRDAVAIEFVIDTPRATLVAREHFAAEAAERYLAICGIHLLDDEMPIAIDGGADTIAIVATCRTAYDSICATFGERATFTTPLLTDTHPTEQCITIHVGDGTCYIRYRSADELRFAEAFTSTCDDDILYYVARIIEAESIPAGIPIYICGSASAASLLKRHYKQVICE